MRRLIVLFVLCSMVAAVSACRPDPEAAASKFVDRADRYVAERKDQEAIIEYGNALKLRPNAASVHYKLAEAYANVGDPLKAYAAYARTADLDPTNVEAQIHAGTLLLVGGEYTMARTRA